MEELGADTRFSEEYRKQNRKSRPLSKSLEGRIASGTTASTEKNMGIGESFESDRDPLARAAAAHNSGGFKASLASDTKHGPR